MQPGQTIVAVTCLAFEAHLAAGSGVQVLCGADRRRLRRELQIVTESANCCGILSFGVAGGLDPALLPGDWVIAASVVSAEGRFDVDQTWTRALLAALPGAVHANISGIDAPLPDPTAKLSLGRSEGTAAVDTESHIAAMFAARARLPFAAARVVLDPAWHRLPPVALVPLRPDGTADLGPVLRSLWQTPSQLGHVLQIVTDARRAWTSLVHGRRLLGDHLAFPHTAMPAPVGPGLLAGSAASTS
jgi:hopanoid-associated phosphorylase